MGKYKKDPNIILKADFLDPSFIKESVCIKNNIPQTVAIMAELTPVSPNFIGNKPNGIRNSV